MIKIFRLLIILLFVLYGIAFINHSSYIGLDGERYFGAFDDAMISMRYAWNLSHGNGLVWNAGDSVEGITNFLWSLCLAIPTLLFNLRESVLAASIMAGGLMVAIAFICERIFLTVTADTDFPLRQSIGLIVFLFPLVHYPLLIYSFMIMETPLVMALLLGAVLSALEATGDARINRRLPILLGLAWMTRPEMLVPAAVIYFYRLTTIARPYSMFGAFRNLLRHRRTILIELGILALFVFGLMAFRLWYYGSPVPNTYTVKVEGIPLDFRLNNGIIFIIGFIRAYGGGLLLATIGLFFHRNYKLLLFWELFVIMLIYQAYVGGDSFPFHRILFPQLPLLFIALIIVGEKLRQRFFTQWRFITIGLTVLMLVVMNDFYWERLNLSRESPILVDNIEHTNIAIALGEVTNSDATLGLLSAGVVAYYLPDYHAYDFLGKSDAYIAHFEPILEGEYGAFPGHNKYDLHYSVLELRPTYAADLAWNTQDITAEASMYATFDYQGVDLILDTTSTVIDWELLSPK